MILDIEHKLNLIHRIHREQEENERYVFENLRCRGNNGRFQNSEYYGYDDNYFTKDFGIKEPNESLFSSFRLRMLFAILLFLCFVIIDRTEITYKEIDSNKIAECISENTEFQELRAAVMGE